MIITKEVKIRNAWCFNLTTLRSIEMLNKNEESDLDTETFLKNVLVKNLSNYTDIYHFSHHVDNDFNVIQSLINSYQGYNYLLEFGKDCIKHLLANIQHPNIKKGELIICHFEDLLVDGVYIDGICILKLEKEKLFFEPQRHVSTSQKILSSGFGESEYEKLAIILFTPNKHQIIINEKSAKESKYWSDNFLNIEVANDNHHLTKMIIDVTKKYLENETYNGLTINKPDRADILNKTVEYLKNKDSFEYEEFKNDIFSKEDIKSNFEEFQIQYKIASNIHEPETPFEISKNVVKKQLSKLKSVIKLDGNFHIYVHGNSSLIEQGTDLNGRKFYKIYFEYEE